MAQKARCVHCRSEVSVPDSYAHGDHIKCGACGMGHKVQRGEVLRLVIADVAPLKEALHANEQMIGRLEDELRGARRNFGIGANGIGLALVYVLWQVGLKNRALAMDLGWEALGIAVGTGLALELANYFFLAKRQAMIRLARELEEARSESRQLQQKIREALRG